MKFDEIDNVFPTGAARRRYPDGTVVIGPAARVFKRRFQRDVETLRRLVNAPTPAQLREQEDGQ